MPLASLPLFQTYYTSRPERLSAVNSSANVYITPSIANVSLNTTTRLSSFREFSISASGIRAEGPYNATAASMIFNQLPACTESWLSRLAASNGTVMTTITELVTISLSSNTTSVHLPGGIGGIDVTGPTTQTFTIGTLTNEIDSNDVCCGDCNILYPDVIVYYWPVRKNNNTWCLQYLKNSSSPAFVSTFASPPLPLNTSTGVSADPTLLPDISPVGLTANEIAAKLPKLSVQNLDPNSGPRVGFGAHLPPRAAPAVMSEAASPITPSHSLQPRTFMPLNESKVYAVVDGSTLISPTVYVVINTLKAVDKCKTVGHVFTSLTLSFHENQLSTKDPMFGETSQFDFADLPCPPENWFTNDNIPNPIVGNTAMQSEFVNSYRPEIIVDQQALKNLDPAWRSCNIIDVGNGYDPPRILVPAGVLTDEPPTSSEKPTPVPHSLAKNPDPGRTSEHSSITHSTSAPLNNPHARPENDPNTHGQDPAPPAPSPASAEDPSAQNNGVVISLQHEDPDLPRVRPPGPSSIHEAPSGNGKDTLVPVPKVHSPSSPPQPLVAGGFTFTPAQAQPTPHQPDAAPISLVGFILAPFDSKQFPPRPEPKLNAPVIIGGLTLNPVSPKPTSAKLNPNPMVVGGLTFIPEQPVPTPAKPEPEPATEGGLDSAPGKAIATPGVLLNPTPVQLGTVGDKPVFVDHSKAVVGGTTLFAGAGPTFIDGTPVALGDGAITIGTSVIPIPGVVTHAEDPDQNPLFPEPTVFSVGETRISRGGPGITLSGTPISFGMMGLVVGSSTIPVAPSSASKASEAVKASLPLYALSGTTLTQGGPAVTISGTPVSLGFSNIVIGTKTVHLPPSLVLAGGSQTADQNSFGYSIAGKLLTPGGPMITVSGVPISLGSSDLVIGTKTLALPIDSLPESTFVIAGQTFTAYPTGVLIDGKTLSPGGPAITVSGTQISLGSSQIQIGTQNFALTSLPSATAPSVLTIDGKTLTANPSGFSIEGVELSLGGPRITVSGTPISLGSAAIIIGTSTIPLSQSPLPSGVDPSIMSGSGSTVIATPTYGSNSPTPEIYVGAQGKPGTSAMLMIACFGIGGIVSTQLV